MAIEQPKEIKGFRYMGESAFSTSEAGYCRGCKASGEAPKRIQGKKGTGRAASVRACTVRTQRLSDGAELSEIIGPAYWPRKRWAKERAAAHLRMVRALGGGA